MSDAVVPFRIAATDEQLADLKRRLLATRWPDPFPKVFGYHEVWHVMTVIAGLCLAVDIWMLSLNAGA